MTRLVYRSIEAWPPEVRITAYTSPFKADWSAQLGRECDRLGAKQEIVLQLAITDLNINGSLRAGARPSHNGVIVSFDSKHGPLQYVCGRYDHWRANVRAIALALEALRAVDRYGVGSGAEQYRGWARLPPGSGRVEGVAPAPPAMSREEAAELVVGGTKLFNGDGPGWVRTRMVADVMRDREVAREAYRTAALHAHPDTGGNRQAWDTLVTAARILGVEV